MSFDEVTLWLVTAMSFAAVFLLFWTLAAVIRASKSAPFAVGSADGRQLNGVAPHRRNSA
jgi:hypothetical protein